MKRLEEVLEEFWENNVTIAEHKDTAGVAKFMRSDTARVRQHQEMFADKFFSSATGAESPSPDAHVELQYFRDDDDDDIFESVLLDVAVDGEQVKSDQLLLNQLSDLLENAPLEEVGRSSKNSLLKRKDRESASESDSSQKKKKRRPSLRQSSTRKEFSLLTFYLYTKAEGFRQTIHTHKEKEAFTTDR